MNQKKFKNLIEMQQASCKLHHTRLMYGTKTDNRYDWITFGQFAEQVDQLRGGLASLGVKPGEKIGIIANNCIEWPIGAYATYGLGCHYVPMYESQTLEEWKYIINDSGIRVLIVKRADIFQTVAGLTGEIDTLECIIPLFNNDSENSYQRLLDRGIERPVKAVSPDPGEPMGLIYTSGTTGNPKGVILTHGNLVTEIDALDSMAGGMITKEDRGLSFLPWAHLMGQIQEVHLLLYYGFSSGLVRDINEIAKDFSLIRPTLFFSVPRLFNKIHDGISLKMTQKGGLIESLYRKGIGLSQRILQGDKLGLFENLQLGIANKLIFSKVRELFGGRLRLAFSGGAELSREVVEFLDCIGIPVYEGYGQTETTMAVTMNTPEARRLGSVGKPVTNARVELDKSVETTQDDEGEIVVYGPLIMSGYHNLPEETSATIDPDGGCRSGDLGRFDKDGYLYLTGRIKEIYKLENGKYVSPGPLEEKLKISPFISQAMICGANKRSNVALIIPELDVLKAYAEENQVDTSQEEWHENTKITDLIRTEIDSHSTSFKGFEKPREFALVMEDWTPDNGLLTPTLKLKRRLIVQKYGEMIEKLHAV